MNSSVILISEIPALRGFLFYGVIMENYQYQAEAQRTVPSRMTKPNRINLYLIGLLKSCGKLAGFTLDYSSIEPNKLESELGDALWYITSIATTYDLNLDKIMEKNIARLQHKYPSGCSKKK